MFQWGLYFFFHKCKFLGIMIDSSIYFNFHPHFITLKLGNMFYTLYNIQKFLDTSDRKLFFNTIILPHIIYVSSFLLHTNKATISALTKTYNCSLKILFKIPFRSSSANLPSLTGIPSLTTFIKNFCLLYLFKIFLSKLSTNNPYKEDFVMYCSSQPFGV